MRQSFLLSILLETTVLFITAHAHAPLPEKHPYQKELRRYLATLKEADFEIPLKPFTIAPGLRSPEDQYRAYVLLASVPPIAGIKQPAAEFTLVSVEAGPAVARPAVQVDALAWLAQWDDRGNPYFRSRAVKLRAFVAAAIDMMMLDDLHEKAARRSDYLGGTLIWLTAAYAAARDVLPEGPRAAYAAGLKKFVHRLEEWGPTGAMVDMDLFAAVSLPAAANLLNDAKVTAAARAYVARLFTDPRYFHPSGYFVDHGCFDTSYNGISLYFAAWAALLAPDELAARRAVEQSFKLRSRLSFPDPDGNLFGPTQCNSRTSSDCPHDQWNFPVRNLGAAIVTDNALYLTPLPPPETLRQAASKLIQNLNSQAAVKPAPPTPWRENHWIASGAVIFAYDHYVKGHFARRLALQAGKSPLLAPPFSRGESFVEVYDKAFLVAPTEITGWPSTPGRSAMACTASAAASCAASGRRRPVQSSSAAAAGTRARSRAIFPPRSAACRRSRTPSRTGACGQSTLSRASPRAVRCSAPRACATAGPAMPSKATAPRCASSARFPRTPPTMAHACKEKYASTAGSSARSPA